MSTLILATLPSGATDTLTVDAIVSEGGQLASTITEHPVEKGANVADHQRPEAAKDKYELILTNTPFDRPAANYAEFGLAKLREWRASGALLSFNSSTGRVENRAIESIAWTRDAKTGGKNVGQSLTGGLKISLGLKEILIVQNKLTQVTISSKPNAKKKSKTGKTATNELDQDSPLLTTTQAGWHAAKKVGGWVGGVYNAIAGGG